MTITEPRPAKAIQLHNIGNNDMCENGISRRGLLAMAPVAWLGLSAPRMAQASIDPFGAFARYGGVYRDVEGRAIGLDRFITDEGRGILFYADYTSSLVRGLYPVSGDTFAMGPSSGGETPILLNLAFKPDATGAIERLEVRSARGTRELTRDASNDEEITFGHNDIRLSGTFIRPAGPGPHPAVILLHGSGPLTRHSFGPYPRFFSSLGFAVLVYDKRGTGRSNGEQFDASTGAPTTLWPAFYPDDLATDALAALAWLRDRPEIDANRIGYWGSSEGGMLATQLPARDRRIAFAINSSGFMGPLWETVYYQGAAIQRRQGVSEAEVAQAQAFARFWLDVARTGKGYDEYLRRRTALQRAGKDSSLYYYSGSYSSLAQMRWSWRHVLAYDSLPALKQARCPVLGLFGEKDILTDAAQARGAMLDALRTGGNRDASATVIPDATHSLMASDGGGMAPAVFPMLREWLAPRVLSHR